MSDTRWQPISMPNGQLADMLSVGGLFMVIVHGGQWYVADARSRVFAKSERSDLHPVTAKADALVAAYQLLATCEADLSDALAKLKADNPDIAAKFDAMD